MRISLTLLLLLSACSHALYQSPGKYRGGTLFGHGSYLVEIWLEPKGSAPQRFNAVFARKAHGSIFNAVSQSGKKLLLVKDSMAAGQAPEFAVPPNELALSPDLLRELYLTFRPLVLFVERPDQPDSSVTERFPDGRARVLRSASGGTARVEEFDWEGHAFRVELTTKDWDARLSLREFDIER